eukprot:Partr_v1_DN26753_c0_g1_i2_m8976 putative gtp cyclohydrolase ii
MSSHQEPSPRVVCKVRARIPSAHPLVSQFHVYLYDSNGYGCGRYLNSRGDEQHMAIVFGDWFSSSSLQARQSEVESQMDRLIRGASPTVPTPEVTEKGDFIPLVRLHSSCFTGETITSARCDCGDQLERTMEMMSLEPRGGIIIYLDQEGRGIGLEDKLKAYNLQDMGYDTVAANLMLNHPADGRDYRVASDILRDLGVSGKVRLVTNNPDKIEQLEKYGISVSQRVPLIPHCLATPSPQSAFSDGQLSDTDSLRSLDDSIPSSSTKQHQRISRELSDYMHTKVHRMRHMIEINNSGS